MSRPRTYAEQKAGARRFSASLLKPSRDHAGQIAALRDAVANTLSSAPPLGILLLREGLPADFVLHEFGIPRRRFIVVTDAMVTWRKLFSQPGETIVFDPEGFSTGAGRFGALIRARRFETIITGLEACRAAIVARASA